MSRIHEALKKAEQERATSQSQHPAAIVPAEPPRHSTVRMPSAAVAVPENRLPNPAIPPPPPDGSLRFDDLRLHCARPAWHVDPDVNVFINSEGSGRGAEQFRTLRSRLYQIRSAQPLSVVLVTSSVPAEGKTFVTSNLAQSIVRQPDRHALIIDGDMRCPRLHQALGAPQTPGLTDYLRGDADEMSVIQSGAEGNLFFIGGGTKVSNPSELLSNGRLNVLLKRVAHAFDWVLIDAPPCLPVADATVIADSCDGILFVVRAGSTPGAVAQRAFQELKGRNILGVVLNAVEDSHAYGSTYYQSYGYGYGYS